MSDLPLAFQAALLNIMETGKRVTNLPILKDDRGGKWFILNILKTKTFRWNTLHFRSKDKPNKMNILRKFRRVGLL
jgi:hypothetical protein